MWVCLLADNVIGIDHKTTMLPYPPQDMELIQNRMIHFFTIFLSTQPHVTHALSALQITTPPTALTQVADLLNSHAATTFTPYLRPSLNPNTYPLGAKPNSLPRTFQVTGAIGCNPRWNHHKNVPFYFDGFGKVLFHYYHISNPVLLVPVWYYLATGGKG